MIGDRHFRIRGMHMHTGAEVSPCVRVAGVPSEHVIVSEPRQFGHEYFNLSEIGFVSQVKFWIRLEPCTSGDLVVALHGAASRYGLNTMIAYFGENASFEAPNDPIENKHTGFSGHGALPPSSGFSVGTNFEESPQMMLSDVLQFRTWQRLAFKLNWMQSSPHPPRHMPAPRSGLRRNAWVTVFLNGVELPWWIPFFGGGDSRGWNIITGIEISSTNMIAHISDFTVSYSEEALDELKRQHEAHMEYLHEVVLPAIRERDEEFYQSSSEEDTSEIPSKSARSRRSGRARKRKRRFREEIQRCPSPGSDR